MRGWRLAPSLIALEDEVNRIWPRRSQASDGSIGDSAHRHRKSDHNPAGGWVTAIDLTNDPRVGLDIHAQMRTLAARGDRRAKYLISNRQIWEPGRGWRHYSGDNPHTPRPHQHRQHARCPQRHVAVAGVDRRQRTRPQPTPQPQPTPVPAPLAGGKPMQIVHVPDNPTQVNPDTWWITDGIEARTLAPGEPEWFAMSGLVNQPVLADRQGATGADALVDVLPAEALTDAHHRPRTTRRRHPPAPVPPGWAPEPCPDLAPSAVPWHDWLTPWRTDITTATVDEVRTAALSRPDLDTPIDLGVPNGVYQGATAGCRCRSPAPTPAPSSCWTVADHRSSAPRPAASCSGRGRCRSRSSTRSRRSRCRRRPPRRRPAGERGTNTPTSGDPTPGAWSR